jgi:uncharacterized SAM-binding protein YcdF (DUF218 family)
MKHVLLIIGLILLAATARMAYLAGLSNNTYYLAAITLFIFGYRIFYDKLIHKKWFNVFLGLLVFIYLVLIGFIAAFGLMETVTYNENAVLVLGGGMRFGEVSPTLQMRLDKTIEYHLRNPAAPIIVSGGLGKSEQITEALAMSNYLTANGIPLHLIYQEGQSTSTYTNMLYSKPILDSLFQEEYKIVVITSDFHIFRSMRFAEDIGFNATCFPAPTPLFTLPVNYVREAAAVLKMWVIGR